MSKLLSFGQCKTHYKKGKNKQKEGAGFKKRRSRGKHPNERSPTGRERVFVQAKCGEKSQRREECFFNDGKILSKSREQEQGNYLSYLFLWLKKKSETNLICLFHSILCLHCTI